MPKKVRAFCHNGKWHNIEVEDDVTAYVEYENGATGVFITTTADCPGDNRFEVMCERGKIVCESGKLTVYKLNQSERDFCFGTTEGFKSLEHETYTPETDGQNDQHIGVLRAFVGNVLRGEPLVADGSEGINGLTLCNAMYLSSWLDQTIELPLDEDLFLNELNKRRAASRRKDNVVEQVADLSGTYGTH